MSKQTAVVLLKAHSVPVVENIDVPKVEEGKLLVKVEGASINPVEKLVAVQAFGPLKYPKKFGVQGVGTVIEAGGENLQNFKGKRITFLTDNGSWAEYTTVDPKTALIIDNEVSLVSAAYGFVNPLTTIGLVSKFQEVKGKGIIVTAAASAVGRMINRYTQTLGINVLNIVRKQEQADILKKEGAKFVIVTDHQHKWVQEFKGAVKEHCFNVLLDCLGGGPILQHILVNLPAQSNVFTYGKVDHEPLVISHPMSLPQGIRFYSFIFYSWLPTVGQEKWKQVAGKYSQLLKTVFSSTEYKKVKISEFKEAWDSIEKFATQGKFVLIP